MRALLLVLLLNTLIFWQTQSQNTQLTKHLDEIRQMQAYDNAIVQFGYPDIKFWNHHGNYRPQTTVQERYAVYESIKPNNNMRPSESPDSWKLIRKAHPYIYLRDSATTEELRTLLTANHPYIRTYAFASLVHRGEGGLFEIIIAGLNDTTQFISHTDDVVQHVYGVDLMVTYAHQRLSAREKEILLKKIESHHPYLEQAQVWLMPPTPQEATFIADTTDLRMYAGNNEGRYQEVLGMQWRIGKKIIRFGTPPAGIPIKQTGIDTIFYRQSRKAKWDTIICRVRKPQTYRFIYNTCCDGFNVETDNVNYLEARIDYRLTKASDKHIFLGTLGETGALLTTHEKIQRPRCRSVMSPNIYLLTLDEVTVCDDPKNDSCEELMCLDSSDYDSFRYFSKKRLIHTLYMPLDQEPLVILYDPKKGTLLVQ